MSKEKTFRERCKEKWTTHKNKVYVVGGIVLATAGGYALIKNWDSMMPLLRNGIEKIELVDLTDAPPSDIDAVFDSPVEIITTIKEVPVKAHIMNLPNGKHASDAGKALAMEMNVILSENQTMRRATTRHIAA